MSTAPAAASRLFVKDLRSGEERQVYADLDQDLQETWAVHGVYPNMDWTPDSQAIVFWAGGKIRRVNRDGSGAAEIPFQVNDSRAVIDPPRPEVDVAPGQHHHPTCRASPRSRRTAAGSCSKLWAGSTSATLRAARRAC